MEIIPYTTPAAGSVFDYAPSSYYCGSAYAISQHSSKRRSGAGSDYSSASTAETFGDPTRAYYAPGQAPPRYFGDDRERQSWDSAPRSSDGKKYRTTTRLQYAVGGDVVLSPDSSPRSSTSSRRSSASSRRSGARSDSLIDDDWTIVPEDSISCFSSSQRGKGRRSSRSHGSSKAPFSGRRGEQMYYEQERTLVSVSNSRGNGIERVQMANERLVIERRPNWA